MQEKIKLYGIPGSLYTAKARSYLIKQQIQFVEYGVNAQHYNEKIKPVINRFIMPVVEMPDGQIIQDGADIIDYFDNNSDVKTRYPAYPESALIRVVSYLFELFGGEGMLRPAMHYRWNFDEVNLDFIKAEFIAGLAPANADQASKQAAFDIASARMRKAAVHFGVNPKSIPKIEAAYIEFLELFCEHLKGSPYLLGGYPTIGDYGLIAPLFAHLARDPQPSLIMKQKAAGVYRWVERMNSSEVKFIDHSMPDDALFDAGDLPETLKALMKFVAQDYLPEVLAHIEFANKWLEENPHIESGTSGLAKASSRSIGVASFKWRGVDIQSGVMLYRFYLLQRLQDCFEQASEKDRQQIESLFDEVGLSLMLTEKVSRRVARQNYLEVWV